MLPHAERESSPSKLRGWAATTALVASLLAPNPGESTPPTDRAEAHLPATEIFRSISPSVVTVRAYGEAKDDKRLGTGFFIAPNLIATSLHTIAGRKHIEIDISETGRTILAEGVVATNEIQDVAIIYLKEIGRPLAQREGWKRPVGSRVYVIANPAGFDRTMTDGIIGGYRFLDGQTLVQISAHVSPGSSGGPVIDESGHVVGMVKSRLKQDQDLGFATPATFVWNLLKQEHYVEKKMRWPNEPSLNKIDLTGLEELLPARTDPLSLPDLGAGDQKPITIGVPPWDSAEASAAFLKFLIERRFGHNVRLVHAPVEEILAGLASSPRRFDLMPDLWLPNHEELERSASGRTGRIMLSYHPYEALQGLCIPGYVQDKFGVTSVEDLARPEIAKLFTAEGEERPIAWIGQDGWRSTNIERVKARDHGYDAFFDLRTAPEAAIVARVEKALAAHQPILFYCYSPHPLTSDNDLALLYEPAHSPVCFDVKDPKMDPDWFRRSIAFCEAPASSVHTAFARDLLQDAPEVARLVRDMFMRRSIVREWMRLHNDDEATSVHHFDEWMRDNGRVVMAWLGR